MSLNVVKFLTLVFLIVGVIAFFMGYYSVPAFIAALFLFNVAHLAMIHREIDKVKMVVTSRFIDKAMNQAIQESGIINKLKKEKYTSTPKIKDSFNELSSNKSNFNISNKFKEKK